jgi:hypothetical protein
MPTLEIAVDARGVTQGLQQANRALDETAQKADRAEREVKQIGQTSSVAGRDMGAAFAATGGGLAITNGLVGISDGFRSANSSLAAFAAAQALLDLGRFAEDMKGVTAATGQTTSIWSTLGTIIKAHPLMTIATVLAGAAAAMGIFSGETEEAADEMERLGAAMEKAQASQYVQQVLGLSQEPGVRGRQAAVIGALETYQQGAQRGQFQTFGQFGATLGLTPQQLEERLGRAGPEVRMAMPTGLDFTGQYTPFEERRVPRQAAEFIVRQLYRELLTEAQELQRAPGMGLMGYGIDRMMAVAQRTREGLAAGGAGGQFQMTGQVADSGFSIFDVGQAGGAFARGGVVYPRGFGTGQALMRRPGFPGTFGYEPPAGAPVGGLGMTGYMMDVGMQTAAQMQAMANEQAAEAENRMRELVALGENFGQTIGDAFMRVADGTMSAKQAMAELVRQFAQIAAQNAFRGIGGAVAGSFAPTQTQATANVGGVTPGFSGNVPGQG